MEMGIAVGVLVVLAIGIGVAIFLIRRHPNDTHTQKESKTKLLTTDLQNEQAKSEIILSAIDDGVALIDTEGTIQLFNKAAEKITGWSSQDAVGLNHHAVIQLIDDKGTIFPPENNPLDRIFSEIATIRNNTASLKTHAEKSVAVDISVSPLITSENAINGAVAVFRDVTQERQEEKQRAEFISTASHEMRTPVAAIEGLFSARPE